MPTLYSSIRKEVAESLRVAIEQIGYTAILSEVEETIDFSKLAGDISSSIVFRITKATGKKPNEVAGAIRSSIRAPEYVAKVTTENGFINFHFKRDKFAAMVVEDILKGGRRAIWTDAGKQRKVIVEYPSANPVHPLHVGHLRNALLGDAVSKLHAICNYKVEREDYIDDLGLQAAEALWGFMQVDKEEPLKKFDHWLGEIYVKTNKEMEDEAVKGKITETLKYMEDTETKESRLARALSERCVAAHQQTELDYGIVHELLVWESDIVREGLLKMALDELTSHRVAELQDSGTYAGCIMMVGTQETSENENKEGKVLVRSNGTATYFAKDIALHMWKFGLMEDPFKYKLFAGEGENKLYTTAEQGDKMEFGRADMVINIIDNRQSYPQMLLKLSFELMGNKKAANNIRHLSYGVVELESGALSGRKGTWIGNTADDLLEEARSKALNLIGERFKLSDDEKKEVAKQTALAAIKFEMLRIAPEKNMTFSWKRALSFEGDSGPYLQYMCARAIRIISDSKVEGITYVDGTAISDDHSIELIKQLSRASDIADKACRELRPNIVTDYLIDLASAYGRFYENVPVLKATSETEKSARLGLTIAFRDVMTAMMASMGINAIERM